MSNLAILARITPKPEHLAEARDAIRAIIPATREESGCQMFALHEGKPADGSLYLYEIWDDAQAVERHYAMPYTKRVFAAYEDWLAKPVEITNMSPIA